MPRWYLELDTKNRLDLFKNRVELALDRPGIGQDDLMQLFLKHEEAILNVITAAEMVDNNSGPTKQVVPA